MICVIPSELPGDPRTPILITTAGGFKRILDGHMALLEAILATEDIFGARETLLLPLDHLCDHFFVVIKLGGVGDDFFERLQWEYLAFAFIKQIVVAHDVLVQTAFFQLELADFWFLVHHIQPALLHYIFCRHFCFYLFEDSGHDWAWVEPVEVNTALISRMCLSGSLLRVFALLCLCLCIFLVFLKLLHVALVIIAVVLSLLLTDRYPKFELVI